MHNYKRQEEYIIKVGDNYFTELTRFKEVVNTTDDIFKATIYQTRAYVTKLANYIRTLTQEDVSVIKIR